jgi:purine-nucleoside phosphorylase
MRKAASAERAASQIRKVCAKIPPLAIVLGSGFAGVASALKVSTEIPYTKLAGFPQPTTAGHPGCLLFGTLAGVPVMLLNGRSHFYEGYSLAEVTFPVRVLAALGMRDLLLTNAAGGINGRFYPGDFMVITDHINLLPENPLRGLPGTKKFLDLTRTYDTALIKLIRAAARAEGVRLHSGVYLAVGGPSYETPAEIRAFARLGADAVGMSTVPEAIVARFLGMRVAGVSCITNFAAGKGKGLLSHAEVLSTGEKAKAAAVRLLNAFVTEYAQRQ